MKKVLFLFFISLGLMLFTESCNHATCPTYSGSYNTPKKQIKKFKNGKGGNKPWKQKGGKKKGKKSKPVDGMDG